jgi:hypothetical protein
METLCDIHTLISKPRFINITIIPYAKSVYEKVPGYNRYAP